MRRFDLNLPNPFVLADRTSEEYAPTKQEIARALDFEKRLRDFEPHYLTPHTGIYQDNKYFNPLIPLDHLYELEMEMKELRGAIDEEDILKKIHSLEQKTIEMYVPYLQEKVDQYGQDASFVATHAYEGMSEARGLESLRRRRERLDEDFEEGRSLIRARRFLKDEGTYLLAQLDVERGRLERYIQEPRLYAFEQAEKEIEQEMRDREISGYFDRGQELSSDEDSRDLIQERVNMLQELVERMKESDIRKDCVERLGFIQQRFEYIQRQEHAEELFLTVSARIRDILEMIEDGYEVDEDVLNELRVDIKDVHSQASWRTREKLEVLIRRLRLQGVKTEDPADASNNTEPTETPSTSHKAYAVLGIEPDSTSDQIKQAFKKLAIRHHPDKFPEGSAKRSENEARMKEASQAYHLLRNLGKVT